MPPANTPNPTSPETSARSATSPQSPPPSPPAPSYLSSPLPQTPAAEANDASNVAVLRSSLDALDQPADDVRRSPAARPHPPSYDPLRDPRVADTRPPQHTAGQLRLSQLSQSTRQGSAQHPSTTSLDDLQSRQERLRQVLVRLNRIQRPAASSSTSAYSNRTPPPRTRNLYDWAPSNAEQSQDEVEQLLSDLRRQQQLPGSQRERDVDSVPPPPMDAEEVERRERLHQTRRRRDPDWASAHDLANQRRQDGQDSSAGTTERMLRYVMDRERSGISEEEERARNEFWANGATSPRAWDTETRRVTSGSTVNGEAWSVPRSLGEAPSTADQTRTDGTTRLRRSGDPRQPQLPRTLTPPVLPASSTTHAPSRLLENALKYINDLRSCYCYEESLAAAIDRGLAKREFFADNHHDFVMDLGEMSPLTGSSWLQPGTVFEGHQYATSSSANLLQPRIVPSSHSVEQINPNYYRHTTAPIFDHPPGSTRVAPFDASRPWMSHQFTPPHIVPSSTSKLPNSTHDQWPVRVVIHAVDHEMQTLQGTMEAYDVPQHPASVSILNSAERPKAGKKHAPITTYVEGHIIDLRTHSFLTPSAAEPKGSDAATALPTIFPFANAHTDAANWRKLPPFSAQRDDDEAARVFLSKKRLSEANEEYIFMRWKERCFVHTKDDKCNEAERVSDQDRGHGLTIGGFYYVSLRRSDGVVEGLYFDPSSTPYQHLKLTAHRTGWPAVGFR